MEVPATNAVAPASFNCEMVSASTPPSTSSQADDLNASSFWRISATLPMDSGMNFCPPNPGFTLITNTKSASPKTGSIAAMAVPGFNTTPASHPNDFIYCNVRCICGQVSTWTVSLLAPASAKCFKMVFRLFDHQMHIQWKLRYTAAGFDDELSHRDVGHETAIHHIHVDPVRAC